MKRFINSRVQRALLLIPISLFLVSCSSSDVSSTVSSDAEESVSIVVTNAVLGSVVEELARDIASVMVVIPNGKDPHDYEPSAKDVALLMNADLIIEVGLEYEETLEGPIDRARDSGVRVFSVSDHVAVKDSDGVAHSHDDDAHSDDHDEDKDHDDHDDHDEDGHDKDKDHDEDGHDKDGDHSGDDPHFLTDPLTMKQAIPALAAALTEVTNANLDANSASVIEMLDAAHAAIVEEMTLLGEVPCKLVTGHNSMRYFADRYGCEIIGAIIPSASSTAEATAGSLAQLRQVAQEEDVRAIFVDEGTSDRVANQIASELGVSVFQLASHTIPANGSYSAYVVGLAETIVEGLTQN